MNDITTRPACPQKARPLIGRRLLGIISALALAISWLAVTPPTASAAELSAITVYGPSARTTSTLSIRFDRVVEAAGTCQADIGYEFNSGSGWADAGTFSGNACDNPDPGYKFRNLASGTTYDLSVRAYRVVDGAKVDFSQPSILTATTLGDPAPDPTPTPTPDPTADPTGEPTPEPTATPTGDQSALSAPPLYGPTNQTLSTISVRFDRVAESNGACRADIGYEFSSGSAWVDAGTFSGNACDNSDPGYKFKSLGSGTTYELSIRAYLLVDGVKSEFSPVSSLSGTTLGDPAPEPTPTPTPTGEPTSEPTGEPTPEPTVDPTGLSAPGLHGPTNRTLTTLSVRFVRVAQSGGICQADIGYEFNRGAGWVDAGTFSGGACSNPDPGYKFSGLAHGTTYDLSVRAYRLVDGVKAEFSPVSMLTATTLGELGTDPTPSPTPTPTGEPTASPTPTPTGEPVIISAPPMRGPVNRTTTTISIVVDRSAESNGVCQSDIGYEFRGGAFADWYDHGGFMTAPCDDPDPGFKFSGLQPDTEYVLSTRAYRIIDGVRFYSTVNSLTISTLPEEPVAPESAPAPTSEPLATTEASPTSEPTPEPSVEPTAEPTVESTPEAQVEPAPEATPPLPQPTSAATSAAPVEPSATPEPTTVPDPTPEPVTMPPQEPQPVATPTLTPSLEPEHSPSPGAGE